MRICFTGGRHYNGSAMALFVLDLLRETDPSAELHVGDCPTGLDEMIRDLAQLNPDRVWKADWTKHKLAAGPIRNREMLMGNGHKADLLIAFPGKDGTENCVSQALQLGIPMLRVPF